MDARLNGSGLALTGVICGVIPRREIWLFFENSGLSYQRDQRRNLWRRSAPHPVEAQQGFGVCFEIDGLTCGYTASSPEGEIESLFCEEPRAMPGELT